MENKSEEFINSHLNNLWLKILLRIKDNVEIIYFHDKAYNSELERGINFRDSHLGIEFPLPVENVSKRDQSFPILNDVEVVKI